MKVKVEVELPDKAQKECNLIDRKKDVFTYCPYQMGTHCFIFNRDVGDDIRCAECIAAVSGEGEK